MAMQGNWNQTTGWKVTEVNNPVNVVDLVKGDVLTFEGGLQGKTGDKIVSSGSGSPTDWGDNCQYLPNDQVTVAHKGDWTITRKVVYVLIATHGSGSSWTAQEGG